MHINEFNNPLTINYALDKIKQNDNMSYIWYPVKTKVNCYIELGGRNLLKPTISYESGLQVKAYILKIENNKICYHENEFVISVYSISNWLLEKSNISISLDLSIDQLINFLDNTPNLDKIDFKITPVYIQTISHYEMNDLSMFNN